MRQRKIFPGSVFRVSPSVDVRVLVLESLPSTFTSTTTSNEYACDEAWWSISAPGRSSNHRDTRQGRRGSSTSPATIWVAAGAAMTGAVTSGFRLSATTIVTVIDFILTVQREEVTGIIGSEITHELEIHHHPAIGTPPRRRDIIALLALVRVSTSSVFAVHP